ncbi:hypothetical protein J3A83DRAFT_4361908 [Scleroderma citrinum]
MAQKVWLITGTSSGFGRRLVNAVLERGDRVIASARSLETIQDFPSNPDLHLLQLDITAGTEVVKARVDAAAAVWKSIDVVVNNAGEGLPGLLEEGGSKKLIEQYRVNVFGTFDVTTAVLPYMRKQKSGTVVCMGSRSGWKPERTVRFYASSKAAVHALGETLALEVAPFNIRVLIVEPGSFRTEKVYRHPFDEANPIDDYDEDRKRISSTWRSIAGKEPGDPTKAMKAVVDVVRGEGYAAGKAWPLYLVLGRDADRDIRDKCAKMIRHLDEWNEVVQGVDFDQL